MSSVIHFGIKAALRILVITLGFVMLLHYTRMFEKETPEEDRSSPCHLVDLKWYSCSYFFLSAANG